MDFLYDDVNQYASTFTNKEQIIASYKRDYERFIQMIRNNSLLSHPDKFGAYSVFVVHSAPHNLKVDMPHIAKIFCKEEFSNIEKYNEIQY